MEDQKKSRNKRGAYKRTTQGDMIYLHKSRSTGSTIAVLKGPAELGFGAAPKWVDMCLTHRRFAVFETRLSATSMSAQSQEWCSDCGDARRARIHRHQPQAA